MKIAILRITHHDDDDGKASISSQPLLIVSPSPTGTDPRASRPPPPHPSIAQPIYSAEPTLRELR
jgi:hypothetical protein